MAPTETPREQDEAALPEEQSRYDPAEDPDTEAPVTGEKVERDSERDQAEGE